MTQAAIDSWLQMKTDARSCQGGQRRRHGAAAGQCRPLQSPPAANTPPQHTNTLGQEQPDQTTGRRSNAKRTKNGDFLKQKKVFLSSNVE